MMNERKPDRVGQVFAALGKSVCYVALFLGMQVAVMLPLIVSIISEAITGESAVDEDAILALLSVDTMTLSLISGLLTLTVVLVFYLIRRKKFGEALWLRPVPGPALLTGVTLAPGLYVVITVALALLPEAWLDSYSEASAGIDSGTLIGVIAVAVVAPVVEEIIFRGLVMNRLARVMPGWLAVILSAAVFGVCHGHPVWFAYAFVLGAIFGFIDLRANSILPSILGHVAFNAIGQVLSFIPETEEGAGLVVALGVLIVIGIIAPILDRRAIAALFRPVAKPLPAQELPVKPQNYDYDPWDE
ncbi:MAG: CPBP family intramembrane metalloprotease [Oscillospiraceae bacterium]|nr:CPBP family intramembrane metalloprotease [Oscillospiraceae bacterium]